ncbi:MAG: GNAT family N-acetyltransferase [Candidatus Eremiobacteraeota bacterium]|nr:GNAT family N-acetyltransferase [Candidatus Eremiobacteraeota bacterium]
MHARSLRYLSFADVDLFGATAALNRIYENYVFPFTMSEAQTALHLTANDIDLGASPLWYDGDELVAAALIGIRADRAWIGGFGVVPEYRGAGHGRALLAQVIAKCRMRATHVQLEVLVQNAPAIATYAGAGFCAERKLLSHSLDVTTVLGVPPAIEEIEPPLGIVDAGAPSWQCERESLQRQPNVRGLRRGRAALIFRSGATVAQILAASVADAAELAELSSGLAAVTGVRKVLMFNQQEGSEAARAAEESGWQLAFAQHEMRVTL